MHRLRRYLNVILTGLIEGSCVYGCTTAGVSSVEALQSIRERKFDAYVRRGLQAIDDYRAMPAPRN
jgi:hypothetical protein